MSNYFRQHCSGINLRMSGQGRNLMLFKSKDESILIIHAKSKESSLFDIENNKD